MQLANEKKQVELSDLDWEDRERVLRLMFSKMNGGQPASNWRFITASRGENGKASAGVLSKGELDRSFRQEDGEYDQEVDADNASNTNIFRKTNVDEYGGSMLTTNKVSSQANKKNSGWN